MLEKNASIKDILVEENILTRVEVEKVLDLLKITKGGIMGKE
jgi:hypothetical protein